MRVSLNVKPAALFLLLLGVGAVGAAAAARGACA